MNEREYKVILADNRDSDKSARTSLSSLHCFQRNHDLQKYGDLTRVKFNFEYFPYFGIMRDESHEITRETAQWHNIDRR